MPTTGKRPWSRCIYASRLRGAHAADHQRPFSRCTISRFRDNFLPAWLEKRQLPVDAYPAILDEAWRELAKEARRFKIRIAVVVEILSEPRTLREIDHRFQLNPGQSFEIS